MMLLSLFRQKLYFVFLGMVISGLFLVFLIFAGFYPVAFVNGTMVTARRFALEYRANDSYYRRVLEKYGAKVFGSAPPTPAEIEASSMQKIIEDILVQDGAKREIGSDLGALIENKVRQLRIDSELQKAASELYGYRKNDFWDFVLVPQAKADILAGRLFLRGEKLEDWLKDAKKSSTVFIFSNRLRWNGEKVENHSAVRE
ncbi:MAG: hypothetical protein HY434_01735 [Candidatus Liptonbacteria bacterium]|nr:hypothetical protein [Candidatus Liptonbacteria bacterium]